MRIASARSVLAPESLRAPSARDAIIQRRTSRPALLSPSIAYRPRLCLSPSSERVSESTRPKPRSPPPTPRLVPPDTPRPPPSYHYTTTKRDGLDIYTLHINEYHLPIQRCSSISASTAIVCHPHRGRAARLRHLTPNGYLGLFRPALVFSIQLINKLAKPLRVLLCPADSCTNSDHTLASPGSIQGDLLPSLCEYLGTAAEIYYPSPAPHCPLVLVRSRDYKLMIYSPDSLEFIM